MKRCVLPNMFSILLAATLAALLAALLAAMVAAMLMASALAPAEMVSAKGPGPERAWKGEPQAVSSSGTLYVKPVASGSGNCDSWADACELQTALDSAASSDEIWVAEGVYYPGPSGTLTATFQLKNGVGLYGGFAATETLRTQRDWVANPTILSGDIDQNDVTAGGVVTDTTLINGSNAYHVVTGSWTDGTAILDGFTITAGDADGASSPHYYGGGMFNDSGSPTLTHVVFSGNRASIFGGGMFNSSIPTMMGVTFPGNSASLDSGRMFNASSPALMDVSFSGNSAPYGGGMYNYNSNPTLLDVTFSRNSASQNGGGMSNDYSSPTLTGVTFLGNSATNHGGGMFNLEISNPTLINITFSGNSASYGGGMYNENSSSTLTNAILWGNIPDQIAGDAATVTYSDIQGGYAGEGNIDANPRFVDPASGNLHLQLDSPAIDAGVNAAVPPGVDTDLDGNPRFVDIPAIPDTGDGAAPIVDMGAYEAQLPIFVDKDAPGPTHDGSSWAHAFTDLQAALAAADGTIEIWAAEGVYYPGPSGALTATFQLKNGVALYGGFAATETLRTQRDWVANPTILSGDIDQNDVTAGGVVTDVMQIHGSNAYHVVTGSGTDGTAILDGFTITAGDVYDAPIPDEFGGGMYNTSGSPALTHIVFSGNSASAGGGMFNDNSSPTLTDVVFTSNFASAGGGMSNGFSSPTLTDVSFSSNTAAAGGGMQNYKSSPTLTNVSFSDNIVPNNSFWVYNCHGGGMYNENSSPTLTNVDFSGNSAGYGGGMCNYDGSNPPLTDVSFSGNSASYGGGMYNFYNSSPALTDISFSDNSSSLNGGGMYNNDNSSPVLTRVVFSGNNAGWCGGGMFNDYDTSPSLNNVTFSANSADGGGGMCNTSSNPTLADVSFSGNSASVGGGMYDEFNSNPTLTNVTFSANSAVAGGGMYNIYNSSPSLTNITFDNNSATSYGGGVYNYDNSSPLLTNAILWGNTAPNGAQIYNTGSSTPVVTYSDIQGGYAGEGNIDEDPALGPLADNGGATLTHALGPGSPAIDAGSPTICPPSDQRGWPRPVDGDADGVAICDMGAYEYMPLYVYLPLVVR